MAGMKIFGVIFLAVVCAGLTGCRKRDIRTVVIETPGLRSEECAQFLHRVLVSVDGVDDGSLQIEYGRVTVTYDSMKLALKNLEHLIASVGFQANEIPPNPEAQQRLPEICR